MLRQQLVFAIAKPTSRVHSNNPFGSAGLRANVRHWRTFYFLNIIEKWNAYLAYHTNKYGFDL